MRKTLFLILILWLPNGRVFSQSNCKEVVGYYPNWQWYDRNKLVKPTSIDYSKYTILNYCFFKPMADGTIQITDPWADKNLLLGPINWAVAPAGYDTGYDFGNPAYHQPGQQLADYCHQNNVKLLPSIGGWTMSDNFPAIAAAPAKRQLFAQQCVALIQAFNFDGIDLDWEYPGFADHGGTAADEANFTLLLQEIRTAIDNYGQSVGKTMLLTIAVGAGPDRMDDVQWSQIEPLVDIINLMSYDFFGAWDAQTNHNSPLFAPASGDPTFNLDYAITALTNTYGVDPQKITAGVAFYGRTVKTASTPGLHVSTTGVGDNVTFWEDDGTPLYYNIQAKMNLFSTHWDNTAKVPYLTGNGSLYTFVSYDDTASIRYKAQYIIDKNLRGAIIWEITGDYLETSAGSGVILGTPLVDTLNSVLCHYSSSGNGGGNNGGGNGGGGNANGVDENNANTSQLFPNPATHFINVQSQQTENQWVLYSVTGAIVLSGTAQQAVFGIPLDAIESGLYFLRLNDEPLQQIMVTK